MENSKYSAVWQYRNEEEKTLAEHIIGLERAALDKFLTGDMSGYRAMWSKRSFTYFDAVVKQRVESFAGMESFLDSLEGKLHADDYRFLSPRVQFGLRPC